MARSFRATVLGTAASALVAAPTLAQSSSTATDLPDVVVTQSEAKPASKPKPAKANVVKPQASTAKAQTSQPTAVANPTTGTGDQQDAPASTTDAPASAGTRSGSLTVPTISEARADAETTPGSVSVVDSKTYQASTPALTIKDALDYVPGVFVQPKWGEDTRLSIRGSGLSRNFHGRGVTLLMDGVIPITTSDGSSDFQEIDPSAYRYVEVFKGANALRYGANSLGGAINFVMPTGYDSDLFGARVDFGSFGLKKLSLTTGAVAGAVDYFAAGTVQDQDGFRDHSDGHSERASLNIGYRLTEDLETRFYLNANHIRQKIPGAVTREEALSNPKGAFVRPGTPAGFLGIGNDNVDRDYERNLDTIRVANKTTWRASPGTLVEAGAFYLDRHLDHPILLVIDNQNNEGGGFGRVTHDSTIAGFANRLTAGVSVHHGDVHARTYRTILGDRGSLLSDADQISTTTTAYAENAFYLNPQFAVVGGTQFTNIDRELDDNLPANVDLEANFNFWSPKIGFLWDVAHHAQVFGNISESHEAATFNEITLVSGKTLALDPQRAVTYELGIRGHAPGFNYELAAYRANLDDELQCLSTGATGTCTQINLDETVHQGVEFGVGAEIARGMFVNSDTFWLNAAYTFNDFRFDNDATFGENELPGAPRHFLRAELLYKHPSGIYAGPNVEWVPEPYFADSANTLQTKSYALLGAKLGFDDGGPVTGYIEARNLTDEAYISSTNIATSANAASTLFEPGNGRAVYGGVQVKW